MRITEPVFTDDITFEFENKWCEWQVKWLKTSQILCISELISGRVFTCEFKGKDDPKLSSCSDYNISTTPQQTDSQQDNPNDQPT